MLDMSIVSSVLRTQHISPHENTHFFLAKIEVIRTKEGIILLKCENKNRNMWTLCGFVY